MIDDSADVQWSTAWWTKWRLGIGGCLLSVTISVYGFIFQHSFAIAGDRFRLWFFPVSGLPAIFMSVGYCGLDNSQRLRMDIADTASS
jgi:hypothetical protein